MIQLIYPKNNIEVSFLSAAQEAYLNGENSHDSHSVDISAPQPVVFRFSPAINGEILLTDSKCITRSYPARGGRAEIYNLLSGERYRWHVRAGAMRSEEGFFCTAEVLPRMIFVEGMSNARDIGGYTTTDGGRVRQGMIFRCSEADTHQSITAEGITRLTEELGVRTDIDLRGVNGEAVNAPLSAHAVKHFNFPLAAYKEIFTPDQKELYKQSFCLLTDRHTYPAIAHCAAGMDRAGTWFFILGALLGIDEGDLILDYEISSLSYWGARSRESDDFRDFLQEFHKYGKSARLAAENFLLDCGVRIESIQRIRRLLTDI